MDTWKKSSTTALLLTRLQNSVTWTTNTHKTTTRRTGCLQPCASFVVLGSQTLTEMKQSGIEVNVWLTKAELWWVLVVVVVWCGSQTLTEMKRSGIEVNDWLTKAELWWVLVVVVWCGSQTLTEMKQSGIEVNVWLTKAKLWWVLVVVVGKYLFFCVELRVVERKCYPTRNLLKYSNISSWNYVS